MIDPDELMRRAVAGALDDSGLSPGADDDDVDALLQALHERGYTVTKAPPPKEEEPDEEEPA